MITLITLPPSNQKGPFIATHDEHDHLQSSRSDARPTPRNPTRPPALPPTPTPHTPPPHTPPPEMRSRKFIPRLAVRGMQLAIHPRRIIHNLASTVLRHLHRPALN